MNCCPNFIPLEIGDMTKERDEHLKAIEEALEPILYEAMWEAICEEFPELVDTASRQ